MILPFPPDDRPLKRTIQFVPMVHKSQLGMFPAVQIIDSWDTSGKDNITVYELPLESEIGALAFARMFAREMREAHQQAYKITIEEIAYHIDKVTGELPEER